VPDLARRLARLRVPLGFLFALFVLWFGQPTGQTLLWGSLVAIVGESLRIWAAGHLNKSREVTSSGPYRWIGHPLYAGSSIMGVGLAIAAQQPGGCSDHRGVLLTTITAAIRSEEAFLRTEVRRSMIRYRRDQGGRVGRSCSAIDLRQAIARPREHRALAGLAVARCCC
jgi:protein-S-isoprenylcysteine O-methyltransferase Ste14